MKKHFLLSFFIICFVLLSQAIHAQYYVKVQPVAPVIVRPVAPSARHIWVEHEWVWRNGAYVHVPGHWAIPPAGGVRWIPGHWRETHGRGYYWVPGHWA
ncbi:MAG TPA: hypothetical protein VMI12_16630 [Puia sp.]|nr:hypothetical protein [Puia sp.]